MIKFLQLLEECNLEDLADEVVKYYCDKQAPSVCSLQQTQITKEHASSTWVSPLDTVRECVQKLIHLVHELPDNIEVYIDS